MKILPISDIHGNFAVFKYILDMELEFDVLTISGDITASRSTDQSQIVNKIKEVQNKLQIQIVLCQGNHDYWDLDVFDDCPNIHLLHNSGVVIDGVSFYGIAQTPAFMDWNHMVTDMSKEADKIFIAELPENLDVLLSHGPPYGYCDIPNQTIYPREIVLHLGCTSLLDGIKTKNPRFVFCGHIHTGDRYALYEKDDTRTKIYNVSVVDEEYKFLRYTPEPKIIEV